MPEYKLYPDEFSIWDSFWHFGYFNP